MVTLKEGKVMDHWASLLIQCQGEEEGLFRAIEEQLAAFQPPEVTWKRDSVAPGYWKGLMGKRRDYILVKHNRFDDYLLCVNARDYGTSLDVCWYLTVSTKGAILEWLMKVPILNIAVGFLGRMFGWVKNLDLFDQQDLRAYVTVGHLAVKRAIQDLLAKRKLDLEIDWKSKGQFGVS